jgi:hypothetical protein
VILSAILLLSAASGGIDVREVTVRTPVLTVGDLLPRAGLPADMRARTVLRLPMGDHWVFDGAALAGLVRRRVPGLRTVELEGVPSVSVRLIGDRPARPGPRCFETAVPVATGQAVGANDLNAIACLDRTASVHLRFDRANGLAVASAALPAQTYLGAVAPLRTADIASGTPLTLRSTAGPAIVERKVTAMQPGRNGARMFVRDTDGAVFAVPLAMAQSEGSPR